MQREVNINFDLYGKKRSTSEKDLLLLTTIQFFGIIIATLENGPREMPNTTEKKYSLFVAKKDENVFFI